MMNQKLAGLVFALMTTSTQAQDIKRSEWLDPQASFQMKPQVLSIEEVSPVANQTPSTAIQQLDAFVTHVNAATGHFVQQTRGAQDKKTDQAGTFAFSRPGKFVWNVTSPFEQMVMSDGNLVYQYDPDLAQVTERKIQAAVSASPAAILFGTGKLHEHFELKELPQRKKMVWLRATPKVADAGMNYIDIALANNVPVQLEVMDSFGQTTIIKLHQFTPKTTLPSSYFRFTAPDGVDRVRLD